MTTTTPQPSAHRPPPARSRAVRHRWLGLALVPVLAFTAACQAPRPDVTFFGNGTAVDTEPTTWCRVDTENLRIGDCEQAAEDDLPRLTLQPGQSVQINVPTAVARQPWQVVFRYVTPAGEEVDGLTRVFDDHQLAYTLRTPDPGDQFLRVRVLAGWYPTEQDEFSSTQSWELVITPEQPSDQTSPDFDTENTKGTA